MMLFLQHAVVNLHPFQAERIYPLVISGSTIYNDYMKRTTQV